MIWKANKFPQLHVYNNIINSLALLFSIFHHTSKIRRNRCGSIWWV